MDSRNLAVGHQNGDVVILDVIQPTENLKRNFNLKDPIKSILSVSPFNTVKSTVYNPHSRLYCGVDSPQVSIIVIDFSKNSEPFLANLVGQYGGISDMAWLDSRRFLSSSKNGTVALWEIGNLGKGMQVKPNWVKNVQKNSGINTIALDKDRKRMVVGGDDKKINVLKITGRHDLERETELIDCAGVTGLNIFSSNNNFLASYGEDGFVKIWNIQLKE
jgi:WD40 repeat protein